MQWTDQIRQVKIILVLAAVIIAVVSLVVSHFLVRDLSLEEHNKLEVWAEAMRSLNSADENTDLNLVLKVIDENNTIPVIVMDSKGEVQTYRNIIIKAKTAADSIQSVAGKGIRWKEAGRNIRIYLDDDTLKSDFIDVCYDESVMIKRLSSWPYVQLGIVLIFVVVAIFALLTSKKAEQNKVWVGLSKETAHQCEASATDCRPFLENRLVARARPVEPDGRDEPCGRLHGKAYIFESGDGERLSGA